MNPNPYPKINERYIYLDIRGRIGIGTDLLPNPIRFPICFFGSAKMAITNWCVLRCTMYKNRNSSRKSTSPLKTGFWKNQICIRQKNTKTTVIVLSPLPPLTELHHREVYIFSKKKTNLSFNIIKVL